MTRQWVFVSPSDELNDVHPSGTRFMGWRAAVQPAVSSCRVRSLYGNGSISMNGSPDFQWLRTMAPATTLSWSASITKWVSASRPIAYSISAKAAGRRAGSDRLSDRRGEGRGPNCLVHNAGKGNAKPINETSGGDLEFYPNHNLRFVFRLCSEDRNVMGRCDTMVNVASSFGMIGYRGSSPCSAAQSGRDRIDVPRI
jgi:hypothetical protein